MTLHNLISGGVLACYLLASIAYTAQVFGGYAGARRIGGWLLVAGVALHAGLLGEPWFNPAAGPLPPGARVVLTIAWMIAVAQLVLERRPTWGATGALAVPLCFLLVFYGHSFMAGHATL